MLIEKTCKFSAMCMRVLALCAKMPFLGCPEILPELLWEQCGKAPAFYDNVAQLSVALNKSLKQILSKVPPVIKSLIYIHF